MNKIKGDLYESYVKDHIIKTLPNNQVYLWKNVPESLLIKYGIFSSNSIARVKRKINQSNPFQDTGIDLIAIDNLTSQCAAIQCKNGYANGLTLNDLAGFSWMIANNIELEPVVYYTSKLSPQIKMSNNRVKFNRLIYTPENSIQVITAQIQEQIIKKKRIKDHLDYIKQILDQTIVLSPIKPFEYQIDACNKIIKHFETNNKAILSLPCGCGKTYTSYMISKQFDKILIISPIKQFAKQNLLRFKQYGYSNYTLLIDSDGTRDLAEIAEFISANKQFLLSVTFKSVDLISKLGLTECLIIIDEFHNLTKANISDQTNPFFQVLNSLENKFLLMSATPRVYELEKDEDIDEQIELGNPVYSMSFSKAIVNNYITDYRIFLPSIHETNKDLIVDISLEVNINHLDSKLLAKTTFLFKCLVDQGARKCIIYVEGIEELDGIADAIELLNEYYLLDLNVQQITAKTSYKLRNQILTQFESSTKLELLLSIRILDECIDVPSCDSIYITYSSESKIRTIQRLCRCVRVDKSNPFKIAKVFIWTNQYSQILPTLSSIKEYDQNFNTKISVLGTNWFGNDKEAEQVELDIKLVEDYVVEIKEFVMYTWDEKLQMVKDWINLNQKRPNRLSHNLEEKQFGNWIGHQMDSYNKKAIKDKKILTSWTNFINDEKYSKYFITYSDNWSVNFKKFRDFINTNKSRPSQLSKDPSEKVLAQWYSDQQKKSKADKFISGDIKNQWVNFISDENYIEYFKSPEDIWKDNFNLLIQYINTNDKKPSEGKLIKWLYHQNENYKSKKFLMKDEMSELYQIWTNFINDDKYVDLFATPEVQWEKQFRRLKNFINKNKKRPQASCSLDEDEIKNWLNMQNKNFKNGTGIIQNELLKLQWIDFINDNNYSQYLMTKDEMWDMKFQQLKNWFQIKKLNPFDKSSNQYEKQLANWFYHQKTNYKNKIKSMSDPIKYSQWKEFVESNEYLQFEIH